MLNPFLLAEWHYHFSNQIIFMSTLRHFCRFTKSFMSIHQLISLKPFNVTSVHKILVVHGSTLYHCCTGTYIWHAFHLALVHWHHFVRQSITIHCWNDTTFGTTTHFCQYTEIYPLVEKPKADGWYKCDMVFPFFRQIFIT